MTENRAGRGTFGNRGAREYAAPGDQRDQHVPAGACGAVFDRPAALRDARSQVPCTRPKGHTGTHENDRGMSWGARTTTTPTRRTTPNRSTPMNVTQLRARMRQLEATHINPTPTRSGAPTAVSRPVNGPLAQARRAVTLARKVPYGGFLPSQADRGLRDLANAASELLRLADTKWGSGGPSCRQTRVYLANRVASLRSVWAVPSTTPPAFRHEDVQEMASAVSDLLEALESQHRVDSLARTRLTESVTAGPDPVPALHPWG